MGSNGPSRAASVSQNSRRGQQHSLSLDLDDYIEQGWQLKSCFFFSFPFFYMLAFTCSRTQMTPHCKFQLQKTVGKLAQIL